MAYDKEAQARYYHKNKEKLNKERSLLWSQNKDFENEKRRNMRKENPTLIRVKELNYKWKVDVSKLLENQGYKCKICKSPIELGKQTHVDHDHSTEKIRGLLCRDCNFGLGRFKDSTTNLENAINYLKGI